jgi:hypothetical protein
MKHPLFYLPIALLCAVLFTGNAAKAQVKQTDGAIPTEFQGNWAAPDCARYEEAMILTTAFSLRAEKDRLSLAPLTVRQAKTDYIVFSFAEHQHPASVTPDKFLTLGNVEDGTPPLWPEHWEEINLAGRMEYTGCSETPGIVPQALDRLMRYIDRIREECTVSLQNDCARVLFKFADENSDNKISPTEIKKTFSTALLLAALADAPAISVEESVRIVKEAKADAQKMADALIAALDKDSSDSLDYNEAVEDFSVPKLPSVKPAVKKIGILIPAFRIAAMGIK